jgi:putative transcriptional regulator
MNEAMIRVHISEVLKSRGVSMYRLAKDTGLAYTTLWKLQNGDSQGVSFDVLEKICTRLHCTPSDLFTVGAAGKERKAK